ncbi:MAG: AAA family ATPase [Betaproteobacteria bacterium]
MSLLYLEHFGLKRSPFQITPDIDFFFSGSRRGDILTALLHVASHEDGIVTAVAEVGSGKTLLARLMISRLPENVSTVYLANPCFSRDEIISAIARDLGMGELPPSMEEKLARLTQELLGRHAKGERVLLVIDEAHTMPMESLEEIRLLSNLETSHHKLINIMLFGQPELDALLSDRRLRQLRDRVIHRFELPPLSRQDGIAYIDHRLRTAGWHGGKLLTDAAANLLLKASGGRARRVNLLADKALLAAYADGRVAVEERDIKSAVRELQSDPAAPKHQISIPWRTLGLIALTALVTGIGGYGFASLRAASAAPPPAESQKISQSMAAPTSASASPTSTTPPPIATRSGEILTKSATPKAVGAIPTTTAIPQPEAASRPPANPSTPSAKTVQATTAIEAAMARTTQRLKAPDVSGYTLQLTALPMTNDLTHYFKSIERSVDISGLYAHNRTYGGKSYVAVYLGNYESEKEAKTALSQLQKPLTMDKPIVRSWAKIRQEAQQ